MSAGQRLKGSAMRADTGAEGQTSLLIPHFVDHEDVSLGLEHAVFSTDALHRWVAECHTTVVWSLSLTRNTENQ